MYKNFSPSGRAGGHPRWRPGGVGPPSVNLGPANISESKRARKLKLKTPLDIVKYSPRVQDFSSRGVHGGTGPPNVNFGPLKSRILLELEC